jgi:hypothetical protein
MDVLAAMIPVGILVWWAGGAVLPVVHPRAPDSQSISSPS